MLRLIPSPIDRTCLALPEWASAGVTLSGAQVPAGSRSKLVGATGTTMQEDRLGGRRTYVKPDRVGGRGENAQDHYRDLKIEDDHHTWIRRRM